MSRIHKIETINNGIVDIGNATTSTLDPGADFTGDYFDTLNYGTVTISVSSDQDSATDGCVFQWSEDGIDVTQVDTYSIFADTPKVFTFSPPNRYFRIFYTNGGVIQGKFSTQPIFKKGSFKASSHRVDDAISAEDDATLVTSVIKIVGSDPDEYQNVDVQHPLPGDIDSVYLKDIDVANSDNGGFTGRVTDYFDDLKSVNYDDSTDNPKIIKLWFNRSLQTNSIGFGCDDLAESFSNIVVKVLGSGEEIRYERDDSTDSTKRNSYLIRLPPLAMNGLQIEFHTTDKICLSNLIIFKVNDVNARIAAVSTLTGEVESVNSYKGALNVHQGDVHQVIVNEDFAEDDTASTTVSTASIAGDTALIVADTGGFSASDAVVILESGVKEPSYPIVTAIAAGTPGTLTLDRPLDNAYSTSATVERVVTDMTAAVGTLAAHISYKISPPPGEIWHIMRILLSITSASSPDDGKFGGISALTNGVVLRQNLSTGTRTISNWKSNSDMKADMYDLVYSDKAPAGQYGTNGRFTFKKVDFVPELNGDDGDYLEILIQDNLSTLGSFNMKAQGHKVDE